MAQKQPKSPKAHASLCEAQKRGDWFKDLSDDARLRIWQVAKDRNHPDTTPLLNISKNTFLNGIKRGIYPPGEKLSIRCTAWKVGDLRAALASIEAGSV